MARRDVRNESMNDLQAKSTNTLALCPFCGGEAETLTAESMYGGYLFGIMCNDCRSRGDVYDTEAEAIAAWNTRVDYHGYEQAAIEAWESIKAWNSRAERTCTMETDHDELEVIAYSHEDTWAYMCSACEWSFRYDRGIKPNYCQNCGRKCI